MDEIRKAAFSSCRQYRYALYITWNPELPVCTFVMLNPSTADEVQDDPTIRRCKGFAKSWGYGSVTIGNLFAYRSTDPKGLYEVADPVGEDNACWLETITLDAGLVVCAWGAQPIAQRRGEKVLAEFLGNGATSGKTFHLGLTKAGSPKHPLYLAAATPLQAFEVSQ